MASSAREIAARLERLGGRWRAPVPATRIEAAERALELTLPEELRALYGVTDGVIVERLMDVEILRLDDLVEEARPWRAAKGRDILGFLPFVRAPVQGDRFAILTSPPLRGRIAWVPTDDGPDLRFDSLGSFLAALVAAEADDDEGEPYYDMRDLRRAGRRATDPSAARAVFDAHLDDAERSRLHEDRYRALRFAIGLATSSEVDALERALAVHDLRPGAQAVLRRLRTGAARDALDRDDARRDHFVQALVEAARNAGLPSRVETPTRDDPDVLVTITVDGRERYVNTDRLVPSTSDVTAIADAVRRAIAIVTRPR